MTIDDIFKQIISDNDTETGDWSRVRYALNWLSDKGYLNMDYAEFNKFMTDVIEPKDQIMGKEFFNSVREGMHKLISDAYSKGYAEGFSDCAQQKEYNNGL